MGRWACGHHQLCRVPWYSKWRTDISLWWQARWPCSHTDLHLWHCASHYRSGCPVIMYLNWCPGKGICMYIIWQPWTKYMQLVIARGIRYKMYSLPVNLKLCVVFAGGTHTSNSGTVTESNKATSWSMYYVEPIEINKYNESRSKNLTDFNTVAIPINCNSKLHATSSC